MIEAVPDSGDIIVGGDLPAGTRAYFDAEWVPRQRAAIPALMIESEADEAADDQAGRLFACLAEQVIEEVRRRGLSRVEISGSGVVAALVETQLRALGLEVGNHERPELIVDTTGSPAQIAAAFRRLADLGTLVLVGESPATADLDLYADVHVRGLTVVGVPRPQTASARESAGPEQAQLELLRTSLRHVQPGGALPADGLWYCVRSDR